MASYRVEIPGWHPTRINELVGNWRKAARLKQADRVKLGGYCRLVAKVPKASGKRRVSLVIVLGPRQRAGDPDAYWKSLLDSLTACEVLKDDSRQWVELGPVAYERAERAATVLLLEDLPEEV